ncbi:MAG: ABC transporter permease, partial [Promethearchaeota archaeon]
IYLLTKEIFVLVSIAIIVSFPVAFYLMRHWLENFAYRITLSPLTFFSTAIMILLISLLTVSYQAIKAAKSNPVNALKYE